MSRAGILILALLGVAAASPAPAQDAGALYKSAQEARRAGRFEQAVKQLQEAARQQPKDADIQVELGLALSALKRYDEAEAAFRAALKLAPNYADAELGLARIALYRGRFSEANAGVQKVLAQRRDDKEARELQSQIQRAVEAERTKPRAPKPRAAVASPTRADPPADAQPLYRWRLDLDGGWSRLTGNRPDWWEGIARIGYEVVPGTRITAGIEGARRNNIFDAYLQGRIDHTFAPGVNGYAFVGGTPDADFFPIWNVGGGFSYRLYQHKGFMAATVVSVDARYSEYVVGPVRYVAPGIEQYLFEGRFWITGRWINVISETGAYLNGYLVRGDYLLRDDLRIFAGYSDAPETSEGRTMVVRTVFGGVSYDLNPATTVRGAIAYEERPNFFDRTTVTAGVTRKF